MKRRALSSRAASVAIAVTLAVSGCSGDQRLATDTEPDPTTTTAQLPAPITTTQPPAPATTTAPPPTTETPAKPAPVTTEVQAATPLITIWTAPRLYDGADTTLSASWQVTPEEAECSYDALNTEGNVIGTGIADLGWRNRSDREISTGYDSSTAETLSTVAITCSHLGSEPAVAEYPVWRVTYHNRHPDSVFPATDQYYFDHDEIRALFASCRSYGRRIVQSGGYHSDPDWLNESLGFWDEVYENWDTETRMNAAGHEFATGWWSTRQLRKRWPNSTLTAENVRQELSYSTRWGTLVTIKEGSTQDTTGAGWRPWPVIDDGHIHLKSLYFRLEDSVGYSAVVGSGDLPHRGEIAQWVRDTGLPGVGPNPPLSRVRPGDLLWDWMDARYPFEPINREPTAWAMRTLLEARGSDCVARQMREHCESGEFHTSPHMRHPSQGGSRLGSVLWSAICPEVTP